MHRISGTGDFSQRGQSKVAGGGQRGREVGVGSGLKRRKEGKFAVGRLSHRRTVKEDFTGAVTVHRQG